MARIFSVLSKVMFFSLLGLFFLQGNSLGHFECFSLQLHISNTFLFHCKVFSMPWLYPSTTPEVSGYPAAHRRDCLWQLPGDPRPDPSAALAIPTRIKNASTIVIWISSGSTHPNAWCPTECRATGALSGSDARSRKQPKTRRRSLGAAPVPGLLVPSANAFVSQAHCREHLSMGCTESLTRNDHFDESLDLLFREMDPVLSKS